MAKDSMKAENLVNKAILAVWFSNGTTRLARSPKRRIRTTVDE
jgi:hypothetical protein